MNRGDGDVVSMRAPPPPAGLVFPGTGKKMNKDVCNRKRLEFAQPCQPIIISVASEGWVPLFPSREQLRSWTLERILNVTTHSTYNHCQVRLLTM